MAEALHEGSRTGDFILREVEETIGRAVVTLTGGLFEAGSVVSEDAGKYGTLDSAAANIAVIYATVDASEADAEAVVVKALTSVKGSHLFWPEGITELQKAAALATMSANHLVVVGE